MPMESLQHALHQICRAEIARNGAGLTDGQLLERFIARRDQDAFAALVHRHGPMVFGVCRRTAGDSHDAEDAFQAAFLVLARKAASVQPRERVGCWLYGVACRTARKARAAALRRKTREQPLPAMLPAPASSEDLSDLLPLLDDALSRLPEIYRAVVVLCELEGHSRKEAARQLAIPEGTLSSRLAAARKLLAKRLRCPGAVLAEALAPAVPLELTRSAVQAGTVMAGGTVPATISPQAVALAEGVLKTMFLTKLKLATAVMVAVSLLGGGLGVYLTRATAAPAPPTKEDKNGADGKDNDGINLPTGSAPVQVLASLDKNGKLEVKTVLVTFGVPPGGGVLGFPPGGGAIGGPPGGIGFGGVPPGAGGAVGLPPGGALPGAAPGAGVAGGPPIPGGVGAPAVGGATGPPGAAPTGIKMVRTLQSRTYDLDDVEVLDTKGKKVDKKELPKLLKGETVAMASLWGEPVDPLHLRVLKEGTLTLVLPAPKGVPGGFPRGVPVPLPAAPGGPPPGFVPAGGGPTSSAPPLPSQTGGEGGR